MQKPIYLILGLLLLSAHGCPILIAERVREQHNHCATKVTCFYEGDKLCCFECGGYCP